MPPDAQMPGQMAPGGAGAPAGAGPAPGPDPAMMLAQMMRKTPGRGKKHRGGKRKKK